MDKKLVFFLALFLVALFVVGCSPSEKQIKRQLYAANYCKTTEDCVNVGPGCPFGCEIYVNKKEESNARTLIKSFESKCVYGCLPPKNVECVQGRCQ
jgi:hypothetical protein